MKEYSIYRKLNYDWISYKNPGDYVMVALAMQYRRTDGFFWSIGDHHFNLLKPENQ